MFSLTIETKANKVRAILVAWVMASLVCIGAGSPILHAQGGEAINSSLSGLVLDSSGAIVPEANVTLSNPEKGISRSFTTRADGGYVFTLVPPGTYTLKVEKQGFETQVRSGIILAVGQSASQDVTLGVGAVNQVVQVTGAAPLLNTGSANMESDVTSTAATELPLNWRNIFNLVTLDSSVNDANQKQVMGAGYVVADQDVSFFNFGGGRFGTTAFLLDGHWDGSGDWDGVIFVPGVDELQEFKIQTHSFSSEYGWSMGSYVNAVTKSGTNAFHGDAFEFLRNSALDANNFFNDATGIPKPAFKRNQFGFTASGPLYIPGLYRQKDKTFIFGAYEGLRLTQPETRIVTIPTQDMRTGNFSALLGSQIGTDYLGRPVLAGQVYNPFTTRQVTAGQIDPVTGLKATGSGYIRDPFAGNVIPSGAGGLIDPVAQKLTQYYPSPLTQGLINNFPTAAVLPEDVDRWSIRVDHNINEASRAFVRFSKERLNRAETPALFGPSNPAGGGQTSPNNRYDGAFGFTHVFSPTFVMNANFGYNEWGEGNQTQGINFKPSTVGLPSLMDVTPIFPNIEIAGEDCLQCGASYSLYPRYNVTGAVDFSKIQGKHTMRTGFMWISLYQYEHFMNPATFGFGQDMTQGPDPTAPNSNTGFGFASFMLGAGDGGGYTEQASAAFIKKYVGGYFQDDWKVSRKLNLSLGVRYDLQTAPTERFDRIARFIFNGTNPLSTKVGRSDPGYLQFVGGGTSRGVYSPQDTNIAPRLGLTYALHKNLIMRAGFGMFYVPAMEMSDYEGLPLYGYSQTTPWAATVNGINPVDLLSNPFPNGYIQPVGRSTGPLTNIGLDTDAIAPTRPTPYTEQWMLGFQYQLAANDSLDVSYFGNHGVKLLFGADNGDAILMNQLSPQQLQLGPALLNPVSNPYFGQIQNSSCGLDQPTVPQQQLMRPFPEFCNVENVQAPAGYSSYNSVEFNYVHRFSHGLQMQASFTVSKYLDNASGPEAWATAGYIGVENNYNLHLEKSLDQNDTPKSLVISYIYALPVGRGKAFGGGMNKLANAVVGGWQVSGISTFKDGFPLGFGTITNTTNSLGGSQRPNLIGNPHLSNPTPQEWFNTAAFAQPATYTFGNAPRTMPNLRAPGQNNWDLGLEKWWDRHEKLRVQFRAEFYDAFNHTYFFAPDVTVGDPNFGAILQAQNGRSIQGGLEIYW